MIVPTGIATDATTQYFFKDLVTKRIPGRPLRLREPGRDLPRRRLTHEVLPAHHGRPRATRTRRLDSRSSSTTPPPSTPPRFALTPDEITLLNPNTGTCPVFRTRRDAEITLGIYRRVPVLINEARVAAGDPDGNPWGVSFMQGLFNMTSDSHLFRTREQLESDGWTLTGNVFERSEPPDLSGCCRCTRARCSTTSITAGRPTMAVHLEGPPDQRQHHDSRSGTRPRRAASLLGRRAETSRRHFAVAGTGLGSSAGATSPKHDERTTIASASMPIG